MRTTSALLAATLACLAFAAPAAADPLCAPFHLACEANPVDGEHVDVTTTQGVEAHAGDYHSSSWGDCGSGNCFHGTAVLVKAGTSSVDVRIGEDGPYPYTLAAVTVAGIGVAGIYHNDQGDAVFGFGCVGSPSFHWSCGTGYGLL